MLESRQSYFSFGDNNPHLVNLIPLRVAYKDYKSKYATNKTVSNSYDKNDKTIEVYFTKDQVESLSNLGKRYTQNNFLFVLKNSKDNEIFAGSFNAKTFENAEKNAKKWCKVNEHEFICKIETNRNIQSYNCKTVFTCTL